jgi:hypothetical protein
MKNEPPMIGEYGKLKTGEIVEIMTSDNNSQEHKILAPEGTISIIGFHQISRLTPDQHLAFLQFKYTMSN